MASKKKLTDIPLHRLTDTTPSGFLMRRVDLMEKLEDDARLEAHRDDHFLFLFQEKGASSLMLDFELLEAQGPVLYYILPGQVHQYVAAEKVEGWFLALDIMLLGDHFRPVFETQLGRHEPLSLRVEQEKQLNQLLHILHYWYLQPATALFREQMIQHLLLAFAGMVAIAYAEKENTFQKTFSRPALITREFRQLVSRYYCTMKQPAAYAAEMHLSLSYLNEVVKACTGFPVTYWIHHEVMLEARRLLYYSDLSVKEIAHKVGYEDHTYFSRLFHKTVQTTPLQFRKRYRE